MGKLNMRGSMPEDQAAVAEKEITEFVDESIRGAFTPRLPFEVGKKYLIRTITMIDIGKVKSICGNFVTLTDASWIGDTGRFNECLGRIGVFNEVEPFKNDVIINALSIVDATLWPFDLPKEPK